MRGLTPRQRVVLEIIRHHVEVHGYPPTLREIGRQLGIRSTNAVNDHLRALERKGYLERDDMKSRALRPTASLRTVVAHSRGRPRFVEVPIVGRVAAGALSEAVEAPEDRVVIDRLLVAAEGPELFGLRVRGDSMIEAGILDGDYVFVRKQPLARRGDVVVVMVGDEATCKFYYPERDHIRLEPANTSMKPIIVPKSEWRPTRILGVVVGVYRRLA
ncbi:MAG: transcriptional repressor LexA [Myxococcota bacterium]|nr:transcriptional repressor LexA [Myxococcota bacterium]